MDSSLNLYFKNNNLPASREIYKNKFINNLYTRNEKYHNSKNDFFSNSKLFNSNVKENIDQSQNNNINNYLEKQFNENFNKITLNHNKVNSKKELSTYDSIFISDNEIMQDKDKISKSDNSQEIYKNKDSNNNDLSSYNDSDLIIVIIRHGERADLAGGEIKFDLYDPELTSKGIKQAYEAGGRLKEILDLLKPKNKKIAILTSPFSRCLMTAKYVKNGMNYNLPLFLENGLCEFINLQWFQKSPKDFLCYLKYNNLLFQELSNEIIINNSLLPLPSFPESTNKCSERFNTTFDKVLEHYAYKTGFNVLVLVTHFFGIQCLCEKMQIPLDNFDIEYCSTFVFRYNKDNKEFKFENNFYPIEEENY